MIRFGYALARVVVLGLVACGDEVGCDVPLSACDADECSIVEGTRMTRDGTVEAGVSAGCAPKEYAAGDEVSYAKDDEGNCWQLSQAFFPYGLERDVECRDRFLAEEAE